MKKHTSQSGSVHAVFSVILVVALLGALGFIFWQNVLKVDKKTAETTTVVPVKPVDANVDLTEKMNSSLLGNTINLKYPKNWTVLKTESGDIADTFSRTTTFAGPAGNVEVIVWEASGGGLGGACNAPDTTLTYVQPVPLATANTKLRYIEAIEHLVYDASSYNTVTHETTKTGTIDYYAYTTSIQQVSTEVLAAKVGDSGCIFGFSNIFSRPSKLAGETRETNTRVTIHFKNLDERQDVKQSEITQVFASDDYKTAKRILLTLTNN